MSVTIRPLNLSSLLNKFDDLISVVQKGKWPAKEVSSKAYAELLCNHVIVLFDAQPYDLESALSYTRDLRSVVDRGNWPSTGLHSRPYALLLCEHIIGALEVYSTRGELKPDVQSDTPKVFLQEETLSGLREGSSRRRQRIDTKEQTYLMKINKSSIDGEDIKLINSMDGYEWRKYGGKQIKKDHGNLRFYFKCAKKGCPAKKYVKRTDKETVEIKKIDEHNHPAKGGSGFSTSQVLVQKYRSSSGQRNIGVVISEPETETETESQSMMRMNLIHERYEWEAPEPGLSVDQWFNPSGAVSVSPLECQNKI